MQAHRAACSAKTSARISLCAQRSFSPRAYPHFGGNSRWQMRTLILMCCASNLVYTIIIGFVTEMRRDRSTHEVHPCGSDMLDSCNVSDHGAGVARPSTAPVPCASRLFRRAAVCADQQLAGESDPGHHATPRQHLPNDRAGLDAVARSASPARTGVSRPVRPGQSARLASYFPDRHANGVLTAPLRHGIRSPQTRVTGDRIGVHRLYEIHIFQPSVPPRFQMAS
jgi:hypothetical protein